MAIHHAAVHGNKQIIKSLITAGADVNALSINNSTPLHFALEGMSIEHEKTIDFLLKHNADAFICDTKGNRPIDTIRTRTFRTIEMKEQQVKFLLNENA